MASDDNLIDFSTDSPRKNLIPDQIPDSMPPTVSTVTILPNDPPIEPPIQDLASTSSPSPTTKPTQTGSSKPNKSLFEITRVENTVHGESTGFDDSELDDTLSETHDSSSTSLLLDNVTKNKPDSQKHENEAILSDSLSVETSNQTSSTLSTSSTPAAGTTPSGQPQTEPTSRFRIVKIAKAKAYDKGKWNISDFSDTQKKDDSSASDNPASPMTKRTRGTTETSDRNITSPTEPRKTRSSEFNVHNVLSTSQSRGSSYNTSNQDGRLRSSQENTVVVESARVPPIVAPVVTALETALDQIQLIKDAMIQSVNEEMKSLRENADSLQAENLQLKEENQKLRSLLENKEKQKNISHDAGGQSGLNQPGS